MIKISIYDINFKEPGPKIPLENITFEEVDTYSNKFEDFMDNLSLDNVNNKIDFTKYSDKNNFIELKNIFGKIYPAPFVDEILKQKRRNDEEREKREHLYEEKIKIENELEGYYKEIRDLFNNNNNNNNNNNSNTNTTNIQKETEERTINRKPTPQKDIERKAERLIAKIQLGAFLTVLTIGGGVVAAVIVGGEDLNHNKEVAIINDLAVKYANTIIEENQIGKYDYETNEFSYNTEYKENIDLGLGVTTPENYSDLKKIYAFYKADPEGFKKIVPTIQYFDPKTGEICNYISFNQFLSINGFFNIINGKSIGPSENEFVKLMEDKLIEERKNIIENGQDGTALYENNINITKGGI
ncbi:MAG: hypothetical protein ACI4VL_02195 [Bacilli bacterium]